MNLRQMIHAKQAAQGIESSFDHWIKLLKNMAEKDKIVSWSDQGKELIGLVYNTHHSDIISVIRVNQDGLVQNIFPLDPSAIGMDISSMEHFQKARNTKKVAVSDYLLSPRGLKTLSIHVPIVRNGQFRGTLAVSMDFHAISKLYLSNIKIGETGYAWMTSSNGIELFCPVPGHEGHSVYENCKDFPSILAMADEMLKGRQGSAAYTFDRVREETVEHITKHAVYFPIKIGDTFWSLVVASSEDEVLSSLKDFKNNLILLMIVLVVGGVFFSFYGIKTWLQKEEEIRQRTAEEALRVSEEKYRLLFDHANDAIFVAQDGLVKFPNSRAESLTGLSLEKLTGLPFQELVHPDDREMVGERHLQRLKGENPPAIYSFRLLDESGQVKWVQINTTFIIWEGKPATLNFLRDISDQKQLEAQLHQAQKMEAVGTLAGGIAHDFNNLLQAITGYTQLLLINNDENAAGYKELKQIQSASERAAQLIRQLLAFSRKVEINRQPLDLNHEIKLARAMLERTIPKMVEIELGLDENLKKINADAVQIEQVILNLGLNAADAMSEGGKLIIETSNVTNKNSFHQTDFKISPGEYVVMTVADTGHGMDQETILHIFEPFYTTKEFGRGTGLGLASVYGIVKSHGGYITCQSGCGQGATFKIYLPGIDHEGDVHKTKTPDIPTHGGAETILVVDDETAVLELAEEMLEHFGYSVLTASSGEQALEVFKSKGEKINLTILDLGMPGMGGHKCLREILRINKEAKIIVASGYAVDDKIKQTLEAGAAGFISKPYQLSAIMSKVRKILDS